MFDHAIAEQPLLKHLSNDGALLFRFRRRLANLRIFDIEQIKSMTYAPVSGPFVDRMIGMIRQEYRDRVEWA